MYGIDPLGLYSLKEFGHDTLDIIGLIPVFGEPADYINGTWYLSEGDYVNASLSYAACMPVAGWLASGGKLGRKVYKYSNKVPANEIKKASEELSKLDKKFKKREILIKNSTRGDLGELYVEIMLKRQGYKIIGNQVTVRTKKGIRYVDLFVKDKNGKLLNIEVKMGKSPYIGNQRMKDFIIKQNGGEYGNNAGAYEGSNLQIPTEVIRIKSFNPKNFLMK